ncbi:MAG: zinc ribbon domain-containing protein [Clostridia bacterium]|nr:zinc ribbon domain-containing protein [Clostridia bacterium]MBR3640349.1 zinc ribbon domain-containing protein [Clostridia bacterium]
MAKFCKKCGAQLADEAAFCPKCGAVQGPVTPQQEQVPPQAQPQPQYQQPQAQPQPKPQKTGTPVISGSDIGFKKEDFKFNPVKDTIAGDLSRYSVLALFITLSAFFFSLINVFANRFSSASMLDAETGLGLGALSVFRHIFMVIFITAIVWVMFKMFLKKVNYFDLLILAGASCLWFLINMIGMIVVGVRASIGVSFAGVLFYFFIITAIAANVLPLIFRIIRRK